MISSVIWCRWQRIEILRLLEPLPMTRYESPPVQSHLACYQGFCLCILLRCILTWTKCFHKKVIGVLKCVPCLDYRQNRFMFFCTYFTSENFLPSLCGGCWASGRTNIWLRASRALSCLSVRRSELWRKAQPRRSLLLFCTLFHFQSSKLIYNCCAVCVIHGRALDLQV